MPQRVRPTLGNVAPWCHRPTFSRARPSCGNIACRPCWLPPTPLTLHPMMPQILPNLPTPFLRPNLLPSSMAPQTKSVVVPRWILTPPTLQHVWPTLGGIACQPHWPMLSPMRPPCGNVAWWPHLPKPLLALRLPVNAASPRALRTSSSPAHIANVQERPCVVVAAKSGRQA
jgi:hypothetical protein